MKVVLFCGGLGTRLREYSESIPKPMVEIGYRPILWHIMKYYAFYGHKEFILCLGYKADVVKKYFLHYDECVSNDFVLTNSGQNVELLNSDISDWKITFALWARRGSDRRRQSRADARVTGSEASADPRGTGVATRAGRERLRDWNPPSASLAWAWKVRGGSTIPASARSPKSSQRPIASCCLASASISRWRSARRRRSIRDCSFSRSIRSPPSSTARGEQWAIA